MQLKNQSEKVDMGHNPEIPGTGQLKVKRGEVNWPLMAMLLLIVTVFSFLPMAMTSEDATIRCIINTLFAVPMVVMIYFLKSNHASRDIWVTSLFGLFLVVVYTNFLLSMGLTFSDIVKFSGKGCSARFIPYLIIFLVGIAYMGNDWRLKEKRVDFIRFAAEYTVPILLALPLVAILVGYIVGAYLMNNLNMGEPSALVQDLKQIYVTFLPLLLLCISLAFYLVNVRQKPNRILPGMAAGLWKVFLFLDLVYFVVSLVVLVPRGEFLRLWPHLVNAIMTLNVVLAQRKVEQRKYFWDYVYLIICMGFGLLVTLAVGLNIWGLVNGGFSVPLLMVLGDYLLVDINLALIIFSYIGFLQNSNDFSKVQDWAAGYLRVYFVWMALVCAVSPIVLFLS